MSRPMMLRFHDPSTGRSGIASGWIGVLLGTMLVIIILMVADMLVAEREGDWHQASIEAANISAAITQDITRNLELYDLSLRGAKDSFTDPAVATAAPALRQLILFDRAATAPYLGKILILDRHGDVVADSTALTPIPRNYADRDYFRIHAGQSDFGLYMSRPLISRSDGERIIGLSRRIDNPDGSFGGVVVGSLRLDYFHQLFRKMRLGPGGSLTLFRNDGTILMREPFDPTSIGVRLAPAKLFDLASRSAEGEYEADSMIDGVSRLYHFHRVGSFPVVQNVGLAVSDVYARWWRHAELVVSGTAICCLTIIVLTVFLGRELRRRIEAEVALVDLVEKDGLTGLINRRGFDRLLAQEWRRAARARQPVAILMIDADQFKLFNDTFGHAAGDKALSGLARCMEEVGRRPEDVVARYGGEEFSMVLPGADAEGAMRVADDLLAAVARLGIPHNTSVGRFSVSIGLSSMVPDLTSAAAQLVGAADAALYRSKAGGRNQATYQAARSAPSLRLAS